MCSYLVFYKSALQNRWERCQGTARRKTAAKVQQIAYRGEVWSDKRR